jgi:ketosteroid isomerase-like protein
MSENVEIMRRWWRGFNEDGMPPLALCDEAIEIRNPHDFPVPGPFLGHDGVRRWRDEVFEIFDDVRMDLDRIEDVHGDGTSVLMLLRAIGTARHSGIAIEYEWGSIVTVRDGKLFRAQGYSDRDEALEAAGLAE